MDQQHNTSTAVSEFEVAKGYENGDENIKIDVPVGRGSLSQFIPGFR